MTRYQILNPIITYSTIYKYIQIWLTYVDWDSDFQLKHTKYIQQKRVIVILWFIIKAWASVFQKTRKL